jgi:dihydrofolate reductase
MRDLIVTENMTLDGVVETTPDWFDPAGADPDADLSDLVEAIRVQREAADAFLVGRQTFEDMRSYWPHQADDTTGISDYLNAVRKYVVSRTLEDPAWEPTTVLRGPLAEEIRALKETPGKDIVCTGSISLVHALIAAGLVDEYRLFVYPVARGEGRRLFQEVDALTRLRLVDAQPFRSGIVLLRYRPS